MASLFQTNSVFNSQYTYFIHNFHQISNPFTFLSVTYFFYFAWFHTYAATLSGKFLITLESTISCVFNTNRASLSKLPLIISSGLLSNVLAQQLSLTLERFHNPSLHSFSFFFPSFYILTTVLPHPPPPLSPSRLLSTHQRARSSK